VKVRKVLALALEREVAAHTQLRVQQFARDAIAKRADTVRDERDDLLRRVQHLEQRIEHLKTELAMALAARAQRG
jgi:uncharacterized coiled-coil DUF342 family protein